MKTEKTQSKVYEKCKTLDYSLIHPFLVPLYLVIDLVDVFEEGMKDEAIVLNYFFDYLHFDHYQEMSFKDLTELVMNLDQEQKDYLYHHLPLLRFPFPKYIYSFLSEESHATEAPTMMPETIILYEWFQIMLKELYEETPLENTEYIQDCFVHDNIHMFKAYIESGDIPLTLLTYRQETLLHEAVKFEASEILSYLLKIGMDPNSVDFYGSTPIFIACAKGYIQGFKILKEHGANLNIMNEEKIKPLEISIYSGKRDFIEYLMKVEFFPAKWLYNEVSLSIAIHDSISGAIEYLLDEGHLTLHTFINRFDTLFDIAIYERNVNLLLSWSKRNDFNFEKVNGTGVSLFEKMLMADLVEMIPWLEEHGFDIFMLGRNEETPLVLSTKYQAHRFFDYYLEKGQTIQGFENLLLEVASKRGNIQVLRYLKEHQVNFNVQFAPRTSSFIYISQQYNHDVYMEFIEDIDIAFHNENEIPLLIDPTFHNDQEVVRLLLEKGANPNLPIIYDRRRRYYPILNAIYHRNLEMVQLLVEYHANVNVKADGFLTPLLEAIKRRRHGGKEVYLYLKKKKAKLSILVYFAMFDLFVAIAFVILLIIGI